ncbi:hypothetical protein [Paenibacillus thiaminolyticus]|uniref:F0F1-type ATP synthase n=1 Tax=Paenibacillus thiaminolyticus TaxID=49283 RepID=A0A3A3GHI7_PANTH|nr:hypothetical protein [Paenibacillus thiaminolyticus]RJG21349.1 hypothetical protein DQX05_21855 [Paenibacillus thiaminolyticus]
MRTTKFAIIFVLIMLPFFWINRLQVQEQMFKLQTEMKYNYALDTAVDDAALTLKSSAIWKKTEESYESPKRLELRKEDALQAFFYTLYLNFDIVDDPISQNQLKHYLPAVAIIGYEAFDLYVEEEFAAINGESKLQHIWKPTTPYTYTDTLGNVFSFTLDNYVSIYLPAADSWIKGYQRELKYSSALPLLQDDEHFDAIRRITIINTIQDALERAINKHNEWASRNGVSYTFTLPTISNEEWNNTIDDVGFVAFIQGLPIGHSTYNNYALGGSRLLKAKVLYGTTINGIKYAFPQNCAPASVEETFSTEKEAAQNGYYVKRCY